MTAGSIPADYRASDDPGLQPYRDKDGKVVTLNPDQCSAILHALGIWLKVAPDIPSNAFLRQAVLEARRGNGIITMKSCLMARLLHDGRPPLVDAPPVVYSAPNYRVEVPRE